MTTVACPGCQPRDARILELEQRVADLEAKLRDLQARLGPQDLKTHSSGPRLAATLVYWAGRPHVSCRGLEEIAQEVFEVPLSLGTVVHLQQQLTAALAAAHTQALTAVRAAPVKNVEETSW